MLNAASLPHYPPPCNSSPFFYHIQMPQLGEKFEHIFFSWPQMLDPSPPFSFCSTLRTSVLRYCGCLLRKNPVASGFAVVKVEVEEEKWTMGGLLVALRVFTCNIMWWVSMQNHHGTTNIHFVCLLYNCVWSVWRGCSDCLGFPDPYIF